MLITGASVGLTVGTGVGVAVASLTVTGIFLTTPLTLTLTVAVPLPTNVMLPFSSTVATSSFYDVHVGLAVEPVTVAVTLILSPTTPETVSLSSLIDTLRPPPPPPPPAV